ncbi:MAG: rhomboid family intramembrane serine protease [Chloroherpetonaceae bacterium]|nr:rhomboid family intramembrane serine protease [Chloroherpetonaceae bacterium]MDW8436824.1 rhomboid family intramembrane serine protease [Chloroherpetonaceae bacterium]
MSVAVLILLAMFALSVVAFEKPSLREALLLNPYRVRRERRYYALLTSGFVHGDWLHLVFNAVAFYFFALPLERIVGAEKFLLIYFGSLLASHVPDLATQSRNPNYRTLGASGAISGAMFAYILHEPSSEISAFLLPVAIPAPIFALLYLAISYYAAKQDADDVNHNAHLWGALAGLCIAIALDPSAISAFIARLLN